MAIVELIYTPQDSDITFCMMVNSQEYQDYKKGSGTPIAEVFNSFDVFRFDGKGKEGIMSRPNSSQLKDAFGSTNDMAIAEIMLEKGEIHGAVPRADARKSGEEQGYFKEPVTFHSDYHS